MPNTIRRWNGTGWDYTYDKNTFVAVSGDTMEGTLTLAGAPTLPLHAATMDYVDTRATALADPRVLRAGDVMTGPLTLPADPTAPLEAATKQYADSKAKPIDAWPVGSVFIGVVPTNPATLLGGGTWVQFAQGRTIIGQTAADVDFDVPEETGGAKTVTLTEANLAAHDHTMAHTHTFADTSGGPSVASTGTESANHTHTFSDTSSSTSSAGAHSHPIDVRGNPVSGSAGYIGLSNAGGTITTRSSDTVAAHAHTVSVSGVTGADTTAHTHSMSAHTHAISGTTSASSAANTGLAGSATAVNKMPPFIVVYMWKRTA